MAKSEVYLNKVLFEALDFVASRKGVSKAAVLNELLTNVGLGDNKIKPVVLQIPVELLGDKQGLKIWLEAKTEAVFNLLTQ